MEKILELVRMHLETWWAADILIIWAAGLVLMEFRAKGSHKRG